MGKSGYFPEKVLYICKEKDTIDLEFDDDLGDFDKALFETEVLPAFPVDPKKETTIETARNWVKGWNKDPSGGEFEKTNDPITVQIVNLEHRSQGGRAYKALVHDELFYVDLREDVMFEAMLTQGIKQRGFVNGQFVWAKVGAQMKLVRVGSVLYKEISVSQEMKAQKKVASKELEVGSFYQDNNCKHLFLGFVNTAVLNYGYESYNNTAPLLSKNKPGKMQLWLTYINETDLPTIQEGGLIDHVKEHEWAAELVKAKAIYPTKIKMDLPSDIVEQVRRLFVDPKNFSKGVMVKYEDKLNTTDGIILNGMLKEKWESVPFN